MKNQLFYLFFFGLSMFGDIVESSQNPDVKNVVMTQDEREDVLKNIIRLYGVDDSGNVIMIDIMLETAIPYITQALFNVDKEDDIESLTAENPKDIKILIRKVNEKTRLIFHIKDFGNLELDKEKLTSQLTERQPPNNIDFTTRTIINTTNKLDNEGYLLDRLREMILNKHNQYRLKHNVNVLTNSDTLNKKSQAYAEKLLNKFEIGKKIDEEGMNLRTRMAGGADHKFVEDGPVECWYNYNEKFYDYDNPDENDFAVKEFTRIVWQDTKEIGIGIATGNDGEYSYRYVVCHYEPVGNVATKFKDNVLQPAQRRSVESPKKLTSNAKIVNT